jgi:DNA polymerase-1
VQYSTRQSHEIGQKIMALEAQAYELAGQPFNLASPKQLAEIMFEKLGLPVKKKTPGGTPSTDEEVLSELALDYPLPKLLLEHRSLSKLKGTYTDKLPRMVNQVTGRVHTHFSQATVVTGRLASSDPNLQNIPVRTEEGRRIRTAFIAPPGHSIVLQPTIRRSNYASWRIFPAMPGYLKPLPKAKMCTVPRPLKFLV